MTLFEDAAFANLLPTVYWRSVFELRCGGMTLAKRAERRIGITASGLWTRAWIADVAADRLKQPINQPVAAGDVLVNGRWLPDDSQTLQQGPYVAVCDDAIAYVRCDEALACRLGPEDFLDRARWSDLIDDIPHGDVAGSMIQYPWDLVKQNAELLRQDWRDSCAAVDGDVHASAVLLNRDAIRIERGARVMPHAVIDAENGPVVLKEGVIVGPGACIVGPVHVDTGSEIKPHAYLHGGTTIGPLCKVGGEIDACVFQGFSNKAHDGFLGHAYVGSWVNLGAGTVNSDLKNTYGTVRVEINGQMVDTGLTFFGAAIGDHVKIGIGQTLPTGAVLGFAANVASSRQVPRFVPSFSWLTDRGMENGDPERLVVTADKAMERRGRRLSAAEKALFAKLPEIAAFFEPEVAPQRAGVDAVPAAAESPPPLPQYGGPAVS